MTGGSADMANRRVQRLFELGAIGTMTDLQLLEHVVSPRGRDNVAGIAFEELVNRHGPMVLRVCQGLLQNAHDAEDAFQAVFLVLAHQARFIRRSGSLASWLFRVARRVAAHGKRSAARRRALTQIVAERRTESYLPVQLDPDWEILHEEIDRLPAQLRTPIILCYLEGLTYDAAADRLGKSAVTIRGRLARGREQLRRRLTRRGVTLTTGSLIGSPIADVRATVPSALVASTVRVGLGFIAGNAATTLARSVVKSILLEQARIAAVLISLAGGLGYCAWYAIGSTFNEKRHAGPIADASQTPASPRRQADLYGDPLPQGVKLRLGTVRFRQAPGIRHIVYSPDGQLVAMDNGEPDIVVRRAEDGTVVCPLDPGIESIRDLAFSHDSRKIAVVGFRLEPRRNVVENHLVLTDVAGPGTLRQVKWDDQGNVEKVAAVSEGRAVATVSQDGTLRLWDLTTLKIVHQERLIGEGALSPESIAFAPSSPRNPLAIVGRQTIDLWDFANHRRTARIALDGQYRPDGIKFSADGSILATGEARRAGEVCLWRVKDGRPIGRYRCPEDTHVNHMAFSPDGKVLVTIGRGRSLVALDIGTGKQLDFLSSAHQVDGPLAFSMDGKTLATTGSHQTLHFWEPATGSDRLAAPGAHSGDVIALACLPDGRSLVSGSRDQSARIWDLPTGRSMRTFPNDGWVAAIAVSGDGSRLVTGSTYPAKLQVWNLRSGQRIHAWSIADRKEGSSILRGLTLTEDGSAVIAVLHDGSLRRWDVTTGQELSITQPEFEKIPSIGPGGGTAGVDRAVFSHDRRSLALIGYTWVQVIDVASGRHRFTASGERVECEIAPNGGSLAVAKVIAAKKIRVGNWGGSIEPTSMIAWLDATSGQVRREVTLPNTHVRSMAFSPDSHCIAAGTLALNPSRGIIRIFRLRDKREIQTIESPCPWVDALCFTPDGKRLIAGLADTSIVAWDVQPTDPNN
jgi:RNA polymerase sigma factor (sigma-70 family)